ncbi:MAG: glycosyltransferase [Fibromonadales bacterium]|nr:glycosyltransferase [Fibromonadales bacterium]
MNILFIIDKFPVGGGTETVTRILSNEFILRGYKVIVCCFTYCKTDIFVNEQIKILTFPKKSHSAQNIKFLNKILIDENINIIINQEYPIKTVILCDNARLKTNAKLISVHHFSLLINPYAKVGFFAKILPTFLVYKLKEHRELKRRNLTYDHSDAVVFLSQKFIEQYKKLQPYKNLDKLYAIADPLEISGEESLNSKDKIIIFVARMIEREKRPSLVLEVWKLLHKKNPEWSLLFLGDGEDLPALKEKARNLPRVEFLGFQKPEPYYERASILLQTSALGFEGFGMTLAEAQKNACIPVAMDSYLSLSDIIEDGKNGFITPNNDINAMAEKIQMLMDNAALRKQMALTGVQSVKKFDIKFLANDWEKLFKEIL